MQLSCFGTFAEFHAAVISYIRVCGTSYIIRYNDIDNLDNNNINGNLPHVSRPWNPYAAGKKAHETNKQLT